MTTKIAKIRHIKEQKACIWTGTLNADNMTLQAWLVQQANAYQTPYLLAHAEDGVIWGVVRDGQLKTSYDVAHEIGAYRHVCPSLNDVTLLEARLFGADAMLHIWRNADGWQQTLYWNPDKLQTDKDAHQAFDAIIDEAQLLWGKRDDRYSPTGFTVMRDGQQGLVHIPPFEVADENRLWLQVRHYIAEDVATGFNRIAASRLVGLEQREDEENQDG